MKATPTTPRCACGSGKPLVDCCTAYFDGGSNAPTAEALMRSRYRTFRDLQGQTSNNS